MVDLITPQICNDPGFLVSAPLKKKRRMNSNSQKFQLGVETLWRETQPVEFNEELTHIHISSSAKLLMGGRWAPHE
jgi:hypothetical protein